MKSKIVKVELYTTPKLLKKADACEDGYNKAVSKLEPGFKDTVKINLLSILETNGIDHFFWAWRCTTKKEKQVKRMILYDIVKSVHHMDEKQYPNNNVIKNVLKALRTMFGVSAANAAYAAYVAAANATSAERQKQIKIIKKYLK